MADRNVEFDLICCLVGHLTPAGRREHLGRLLAQPIDWERFLALAHPHGVVPLIHRGLGEVHPGTVPASVRARLRAASEELAQRNLLMLGELLRLLEMLEHRGVAATPLKGPVLAVLAYGDVSLRHFADLDIVIDPDLLEPTREILTAQGYQPVYPLADVPESTYLKFRRAAGYHTFAFISPENEILVDCHLKTPRRVFPGSLVFNALLDEVHSVQVSGQWIRVPPPENLLLFLCMHGSKHHWSRLEWLCDVAELVRTQRLDWQLILDRAAAWGVERMLMLGLLLAAGLLNAPVPGRVLQRARSRRRIGELARLLGARLHTTTDSMKGADKLAAELSLLQGLGDKISHCHHLATAVSNTDLELVRFPPAMFPAYFLLRPVRQIFSHGGGLVRHVAGSRHRATGRSPQH